MQIYIHFEGDDLIDVAADIHRDLTDWATEFPAIAVVGVKVVDDEADDSVVEFEQLGIRLDVNKREKLKDPLDFLYQVAKQYKVECVVGIIENDNHEDICYFGHAEGKPDVFEVGTYIGLKR
ncbi:Uncharacterised protein [BD1-7 clade bacterium]|uniref:Uncharacterized protein n=1 Tax=BD1-7 clade bacterium TaxID=2029982 RepID=A0A5S9QT84_9GAMM|nr:Uncharacterised protein [BD1-7 clade bacterium]